VIPASGFALTAGAVDERGADDLSGLGLGFIDVCEGEGE
jgi:hypothetical protein